MIFWSIMHSWYLGEINVSTKNLLENAIVERLVDKQVFPSLELIGWYSVAPVATSKHIALHEQVYPCVLHRIRASN